MGECVTRFAKKLMKKFKKIGNLSLILNKLNVPYGTIHDIVVNKK